MPAARYNTSLFLAALTIGELRRGIELVCQRGDQPQAQLLEQRAIRGLAGTHGPLGRGLLGSNPHQGLKKLPDSSSVPQPWATAWGLFNAGRV